MDSGLVSEDYLLGRRNKLRILRVVSIGAYLEWSCPEGILLPKAYLGDNPKEGDIVEAFVYHDNEGRLIATTLTPLIEVGSCALLECVSTSSAGAFVQWGIHKDLLVPFSEQRSRMQEGKKYMIYAYIDHVSGKIVGSAKLNKHIGLSLPDYSPGEKVQGVVAEMIDIGYRIVVDQRHWGMIYFSELKETAPKPAPRTRLGGRKDGLNLRLVDDDTFSTDASIFEQTRRLRRGEIISAYVVRLRDDGRLDLSLNPIGYGRIEQDAKDLLGILQRHEGYLPVGDKSAPEEVLKATGMSKKTFKKALGKLLKIGCVDLEERAIYLKDTDQEEQ